MLFALSWINLRLQRQVFVVTVVFFVGRRGVCERLRQRFLSEARWVASIGVACIGGGAGLVRASGTVRKRRAGVLEGVAAGHPATFGVGSRGGHPENHLFLLRPH
jgi:hypothetical protein